MSDADVRYMLRALQLAKLGYTAPNPMVGCVLVRGGIIVGEGYHHRPGMAHAEVEALHQAANSARGATAYVSLEPCSHTGKTPPCADALIKAKVSRVVAAMLDPNPKVHGQGFEKLRQAGITVEQGLCEAEACKLNEMFVYAQTHDRPWLTAKFACSLDGRIAAPDGSSQWITGPIARAQAHLMRARHDALMVGIGTVLTDDPSLTVRHHAVKPTRLPVRVVVDTSLRIPLSAKLCDVSEVATWVLCSTNASFSKRAELMARGVEVIDLPVGSHGHVDFVLAMKELYTRGITAVMCDGGSGLLGSLFDEGLVNRVTAFIAPMILGSQGLPAIKGQGAATIDQSLRLTDVSHKRCGDDMMMSGLVPPCCQEVE